MHINIPCQFAAEENNQMIFIIFATLISLGCLYYMPKRLTPKEIYATRSVLAAIAINADLTLGNIIDLYDLAKARCAILRSSRRCNIPPVVRSTLPKLPVGREWQKQRRIYVLGWTLATLLIEWRAVLFGFEDISKGWSPFYSTPIYLLVFLFLNWHI